MMAATVEEKLAITEMARQLRTKAATEKANRCHYSATLLTRAANLLERQAAITELVAWLRERATWCTVDDPAHEKYDRAADLLERLNIVPPIESD